MHFYLIINSFEIHKNFQFKLKLWKYFSGGRTTASKKLAKDSIELVIEKFRTVEAEFLHILKQNNLTVQELFEKIAFRSDLSFHFSKSYHLNILKIFSGVMTLSFIVNSTDTKFWEQCPGGQWIFLVQRVANTCFMRSLCLPTVEPVTQPKEPLKRQGPQFLAPFKSGTLAFQKRLPVNKIF